MPRKSTKKMAPKVQVKKLKGTSKESVFSMIVGTVLVALGLLLFVSGVVTIVLYNLPARENFDISKPTLSALPAVTNQKSLVISGFSEYKKVAVWVNDEVVAKNLSVNNGEFAIEYPVEKEGSYKIEVASVDGFPIKHRSEKLVASVLIDWTAPSNDVKFSYKKEVDVKAFTLSGTVESNATVVLKKSDREYSSVADEFGKFSIKNIPLSVGKNKFEVSLKDNAGNVAKIDSPVVVAYVVGDLNGNGASTSELPVSSGLFSNQSSYVVGNMLMQIFGIVALLAFVINGSIVAFKLKRSNS